MEPIKEVVFERVYDAPIAEVWRAWTDPEELKKWWGPDNVIIPECEVEPRVGGKFYIVMEADAGMGQYQGTRWPMLAEFTAFEPNTRITFKAKAWTEGAEKETEIGQITDISFQDLGGKTKVNLKATINSTGPGAKMAVEGMQYGFTQQLDKLEKFLATR